MILPPADTQLPDRLADGLYTFDIRSTDVDFADQLQLPSLFAYLQEAAYRHAEQLGIGASCLDQLDLSWVLTKISLRLSHLPVWGEQVQVRTWSRGAEKLLFVRDFILSAGPVGGPYLPFGRASSEWLVVSRGSHRPQRPATVLEAAGLPASQAAAEQALDFPCPKLTAAPEARAVLRKYADFSEIDRNRHLNNTRYIAWAVDALYADQLGDLAHLVDPAAKPLRIQALDIHYLQEIKPGEPVDLAISPSLQVEGTNRSTGICSFRVRFILETV